jgi:hypothetical protein
MNINMYIFITQAYESKNEMGNLEDVVTLELIAKSEKEAIKKAKTIIKRPFYRVSGVIEKNDKS